MIELPETFTIARQMNNTLPGRKVINCIVNQSAHKFAFFKPQADQIPDLLTGRTLMEVTHNGGNFLQIELDRGSLDFGEMGGRILLSQSTESAPPKHQLLLELDDRRILTASIVLWGFIQVIQPGNQRGPEYKKIPPLGDDFTFQRFQQLFSSPEITSKTSVKYFIISRPGLSGVGNGCLQDILLNAGIHPRRCVASLTMDDQRMLFEAIQTTLLQMVAQGGRDSERDLFNQTGGYRSILGSHAVGKPCPRCSTPIEKISFLGGASYFCPHCQL